MACNGCRAASSSISTVGPIGRSPPPTYRQDRGGCSTIRSFLILNVAVGGGSAGSPDASTTFLQALGVDYVRVYQ
jgi:hypothetical protein